MPKKSYAFEPGGPKRLAVEWKGLFNDFTVKVDGKQVGTITDQRALNAGEKFKLKDGSQLEVRMINSMLGSEMRILRNGKPLPDSATSVSSRLHSARVMIFIIAAIEFFDGISYYFLNENYIKSLGISWYALYFGAFFLIMGLLMKKSPRLILWASTIVFLADAFINLWVTTNNGSQTSIFGLLVRVFFVIPMLQALRAMADEKKEAQAGKKKK
jgi:hypothetical protein